MLSRKRRTITGNLIHGYDLRIKPSKTRKIIRRYHFLSQKRRYLCQQLNISGLVENDEAHNLRLVERSLIDSIYYNAYKAGYSIGMTKNADLESMLLKVNSVEDKALKMKCLGYIMREIGDEKSLQTYQLASIMGQDKNRGGDSSKILVKWLHELGENTKNNGRWRALEIGSLSSENYISKSRIFHEVVRIDLNNLSNNRSIMKQDFMKRPIPSSDEGRFDLISCSLVLNFVPTPMERGRMCARFTQFLNPSNLGLKPTDRERGGLLFIVLPKPCLENSRFIDIEWFDSFMMALGYKKIRQHTSTKLSYMLYRQVCSPNVQAHKKFSIKKLLYNKPGRNNFSIILPLC